MSRQALGDSLSPDNVLRFSVLGPLVVEDPIGSLALPGVKERTLLCLLAARANQVVPSDELVDGLWGSEPPPTAEKSLQAHVVRLRDALEPNRPRGQSGSLIFTVDPGYVLRCDLGAIDAARFEELAADGHRALDSGAAATAARLLGEALSLWRGRPYAEFDAEPLERERTRLIEIERNVHDDLAQAELDLGHHHELIPSLEEQVGRDTINERAWAQLMLALYRDGRQADALAAFHRARQVLDDELGIEPGDELQQLQRQLLDQDPALLEGVDRSVARRLPAGLSAFTGPFVDRQTELAALSGLWENASALGVGRLPVVLIHGAEGMGKTRLVAEFARSIGPRVAILYASGNPRTSERLAIFGRLADSIGRTELGPLGAASPESAGAIGSAVARTSANDSVLVALDDFPAGNADAVAGLDYFLAGLGATRGLVIVTSETSSDMAATRLFDLGPLEVSETVEIVTAYTGDKSAALAAADIAPAARGVPALVHREAAAWARRQTETEISVAAGRLAEERAVLGQTREDLRARITSWQALTTFQAPAASNDVVAERSVQSSSAAPYKGLSPFEVDDADIFFGREHLAGRLAAHLAETSLLVLVGPSGSGKSSLVRAGLLASLADGLLPGSETWHVEDVELERADCADLDAILGKATASSGDGRRAVLFIDQLEQLFTRCSHAEHRQSFLDRLAGIASDPSLHVSVIATLRSDYFGNLGDSPAFAAAAGGATEVVGPMSIEELQRAIELPAQRTGIRLEAGLAAAIAADAHGRPGGLPLLSTALLELWEKRKNGTLTWAAYRRSGGLAGAVSRLAEDAFGQLATDEQQVARRILLRTVGAAEGSREVSRRVRLAELAGEGQAGERVLATLSERRLVTVDGDAVEVTHEALYQQWPRLRGWLDEDRRGREIHRRLITAAREWDERGREQSDLYRGVRLAAARDWAESHDRELNALESDFLAASNEVEEGQAAAERERTRQTLRVNRRLKYAAVGLGVLVIASTVIGGVAVTQSQAANREALAASAARLGSTALVQPSIDRELLLAAAAYGIDNSIDTRGALLAALTRSPQTTGVIHGASGERFLDAAVSPDGRFVAVGANAGTIAVWDWQARKRVALINAGFPCFTIGYSSDGNSILAAQAEDNAGWRIHRWNVADGTEMPEILVAGVPMQPGSVDGVVFARNAPIAAARTSYGEIYKVDLTTGLSDLVAVRNSDNFPGTLAISADGQEIAAFWNESIEVFNLEGDSLGKYDMSDGIVKVPVLKMAFSPDGKQLALAADDGMLHVIDPIAGTHLANANPHTAAAYDLAFTPDGGSIISGSEDDTVAQWQPDTGRIDRLARGHTGRVFAVGVTPDGNTAFSAAADSTMLIWDLSGKQRFGTLVQQLPRPRPKDGFEVLGWASSADGSRVALAYTDGTVAAADLSAGTTWEVDAGIGTLAAAAFSHDGKSLAVAGQEGRIAVLDPATGKALRDPIDGYGRWIGNLAYSPDDRSLAVAEDQSGWIVDMTTGTIGPELFSDSGAASLAWSADGQRVAFGTYDGNVIVRDVANKSLVERIHVDDVTVYAVAWSRDGSKLATGSASGAAQLWSTNDWQPIGPGFRAHGSWVLEARFSENGRWLATFGGDGAAAIWDVTNGRQLGASLVGTRNEFGGMWLSDDGSRLTIYQTDGSVWSWPLDDATWLKDVCSIAGRDLTADEWQTYAPNVPATPVCSGPAG